MAVCAILILAACSPMGPRRLAMTPNGGWTVQDQKPLATLSDYSVNPDRGSLAARSLAVSSWEHFESFDVGIIEFREDGSVFSEQQRKTVLDNVRRLAFAKGATIVVYAHGWHHSARWNDTNLVSFRRVLRTLAKQRVGMPCDLQQTKPTNVVGVYIGWRGESVPVPGANLVTIWSRKKVAQRIGGAASDWEQRHAQYAKTDFRQVLTGLDQIREEANRDAVRANRSFTSLVIAGHSLGGAMILSAMQRVVFNATFDQAKVVDPDKLHRLGDAVVLLNPAVEARRYKAFRAEAAQAHFTNAQRPILLTISSTGDWPNRIAFRVARFFPTLFMPPRWHEWRDSTTALGFSDPDVTHCIEAPDELLHATLEETDEITGWPGDVAPDPDKPETINLTAGRRYGKDGKISLINERKIDDFVPFFVTSSNQAVIPDHSDIFTPGVVSFLVPFVAASERKGVLPVCDRQPLVAQGGSN